MTDPTSTQPPANPDLDDLNRGGLFVIGNARSGTTIFSQCLNLSKEILVLIEANLFLNHQRSDFIESFNASRRASRYPAYKGSFIPPASGPADQGLNCLTGLRKHHRYVGEKIALGVGGEQYLDKIFDFQAQYFYYAQYFLLIRRPSEVIWSMSKMWPAATIPTLVASWLRTVNLLIDIHRSFPATWLVFLENLGPATFETVNQILKTDIRVPRNMLGRQAQASVLRDNELPERLQPYSAFCERCDGIYRSLKAVFDPERLTYCAEQNPTPVFAGLKDTIATVLDEAELHDYVSPRKDWAAACLTIRRLLQAKDYDSVLTESAQLLTEAGLDPALEFWARYKQGTTLMLLGDFAAAYKELERATALQPYRKEVQEKWLLALKGLARNQVSTHQYQQALGPLDVLVQKEPLNPEWSYLYGYCLRLEGINLRRALGYFRQALESGYDEFWIRWNCGNALHQLGEYKPALAELDSAARLFPSYPYLEHTRCLTLEALAKEYINQNQLQDGLDILQRLLSIQPNQAEWNYLTGCHQADQPVEPQQALKYFDRALENGYREYPIRIQRGHLQWRLGRLEAALDDLERASILSTSFTQRLLSRPLRGLRRFAKYSIIKSVLIKLHLKIAGRKQWQPEQKRY